MNSIPVLSGGRWAPIPTPMIGEGYAYVDFASEAECAAFIMAIEMIDLDALYAKWEDQKCDELNALEEAADRAGYDAGYEEGHQAASDEAEDRCEAGECAGYDVGWREGQAAMVNANSA